MAERRAAIFGTEKDQQNCPFYLKIGACRHGDRCSRLHNKPVTSQTILLPNLYQSPISKRAIEQNGGVVPNMTDAELQQHFDEFYEDIYEGLAKYGTVDLLNVCANLGDHLIGNVYVKYAKENEAEDSIKGLHGRFYDGRPIISEFSPVTDFTEARCRQFDIGTCTRGGYCNFMHLHSPSKTLYTKLFGDKKRSPSPKRREFKERSSYERERGGFDRGGRDKGSYRGGGGRGGYGDREFGRDRDYREGGGYGRDRDYRGGGSGGGGYGRDRDYGGGGYGDRGRDYGGGYGDREYDRGRDGFGGSGRGGSSGYGDDFRRSSGGLDDYRRPYDDYSMRRSPFRDGRMSPPPLPPPILVGGETLYKDSLGLNGRDSILALPPPPPSTPHPLDVAVGLVNSDGTPSNPLKRKLSESPSSVQPSAASTTATESNLDKRIKLDSDHKIQTPSEILPNLIPNHEKASILSNNNNNNIESNEQTIQWSSAEERRTEDYDVQASLQSTSTDK